ncbi:hypothetical protein [Bacillus safensis]|uniref:hypothetical protein n=1 Tax=Bacillus safensis TaxID=561879 RepID=UPI002E23AE11|nr:hypothetical protein [Bacillus safensis]
MDQQSFTDNDFIRPLGIIGGGVEEPNSNSDQNNSYILTAETVPAGTTAESEYGAYPYRAVDGRTNDGGFWDPKDNKGTFFIQFPRAIPLAGIQFVASNNTFTDSSFRVKISYMMDDPSASWKFLKEQDIMVPSQVATTESIIFEQSYYKRIKIEHSHNFNRNIRFYTHEVLIHKYI